jgi:hypothetical protein
MDDNYIVMPFITRKHEMMEHLAVEIGEIRELVEAD